jgi:hypothetical protein
MARDHYVQYGHREPRVYKRFPLAMRWAGGVLPGVSCCLACAMGCLVWAVGWLTSVVCCLTCHCTTLASPCASPAPSPPPCRYTACGGLMNQHYSHVAALTIAMQIGAEVIMPYALKRDSFGKYFNPDPSKNRWVSLSLVRRQVAGGCAKGALVLVPEGGGCLMLGPRQSAAAGPSAAAAMAIASP